MSNDPIRIILVDDHPAVLISMRMLLGSNPLFHVIADCEDGPSAIAEAERLVPDIVMIDVNMSPIDGFTLTEELLARIPSVKIIALSINNQPKYAEKMMSLGAKAYLTKTSPPKEIMQCIIDVHKGETYLCSEVRNQL